ncbi:uncharacterized protein LTR77_004134 [Saxophila tyrrhenica]|uniref:BZIP domain-containing protein n=1 Tax=Saxophila tyrrhenica TaxID=1690608 RepID=A0AAV9PG52_9PEZI|nr:hypothetical protein LTR77_004134 [Saxophila tyrrhenica]
MADPRHADTGPPRMPQQLSIIVGQHEDWSGVSDPLVRRKLQNRIHQRQYRKRRDTKTTETRRASQNPAQARDLQSLICRMFDAAAGGVPFDARQCTGAVAFSKAATLVPEEALISYFQAWQNSVHRGPTHGLRACASPYADQVLVLAKFNVFRALMSNSLALGFATENGMDDDAASPFCDSSQSHRDLSSLPVSMFPTRLQREIDHHPWIDLLPCSNMRDNILRAENFDDMALCGDLVGIFSASTLKEAGLLVWGDPWVLSNWEMTQDFSKHWSWLIEGCWELWASTNKWRQCRGEEPLAVLRVEEYRTWPRSSGDATLHDSDP